jgi:hypothetical protein
MLCGLGFVSAIIVSFLDIYGVKQLGDADNLRTESKKVVSYMFLPLIVNFYPVFGLSYISSGYLYLSK